MAERPSLFPLDQQHVSIHEREGLSSELLPLPAFEEKPVEVETKLQMIFISVAATGFLVGVLNYLRAYWISTLIGAGIIAYLSWQFGTGRKRLETRLVTSGHLVRAIVMQDSTGEDGRYVDYKFLDANGKAIIGASRDTEKIFVQRDKIDVLYDPTMPETNFAITDLKYYRPSLSIFKR